ncbi:hypothetical protein [Alkalicoccus chagannorensis]|uniref:hypothetical protein n=1 Tax=Alkalicoccus chagannorensis TaxID=427072 RepID=UPI00041C2122|nr:hypothetical protein [Alkalicoccus chagannorensis]
MKRNQRKTYTEKHERNTFVLPLLGALLIGMVFLSPTLQSVIFALVMGSFAAAAALFTWSERCKEQRTAEREAAHKSV